MRISAAFVGLVLFLSPSVGNPQDSFDQFLRQMNKVQRELEDRIFELEMKVGDQQKIIQTLEQRDQKLEGTLKDSQREIQNVQIDARILSDKTSESQKHTAELEHRLNDQVDGLHKVDLRLVTVETNVALQNTELKTATLKLDNLTPALHPAGTKTAASAPRPLHSAKPAATQSAHLSGNGKLRASIAH